MLQSRYALQFNVFNFKMIFRGSWRVLPQIDDVVRFLQLTTTILYLRSCNIQIVIFCLRIQILYLIVAGVFSRESWRG